MWVLQFYKKKIYNNNILDSRGPHVAHAVAFDRTNLTKTFEPDTRTYARSYGRKDAKVTTMSPFP